MDYLPDPSGQIWDVEAPSSPLIVHESEALAIYPRAADFWQVALLYGAPPNPVLVGDLGDSSNKRRVRIIAPAYATHAQVVVVASGTGSVSIQEVGETYACQIPIQGNSDGVLLEDDAVICPGEPTYDTPSGVVSRMIALSSGASPCYTTDIDLWKSAGGGGLTVWSVSLRFTRITKSLT